VGVAPRAPFTGDRRCPAPTRRMTM
jgi:hypothetical protein